MILYHAITCEDDRCDPPRTVDNAPRLPVVLDGCPIADHTIIGGRHTAEDLDALTYVAISPQVTVSAGQTVSWTWSTTLDAP